jgi:predicted exporter
MHIRLDRKHRTPAIILGVVTLADVVVLLLWDAFPGIFPAGSHAVLGAVSLALIAVAYLVYQLERRPAAAELVKAIMLAAAFLFWAANQFWPNSPRATLFNDVAIALFVLDVFLVIVGWPAALPDSSFGETGGK